MPPNLPFPVFLQAAEVGKIATDAASAATKGASDAGPLTALLWCLVVFLCIFCGLLIWRHEKTLKERQVEEKERLREEKDRHKEVRDAVAGAREEWARELAVDMAHAEKMQQQQQEQYERQIEKLHAQRDVDARRLEEINRELRVQEGKSIEVIGATGHKIRDMFNIVSDTNARAQRMEDMLRASMQQSPAITYRNHLPPPAP